MNDLFNMCIDNENVIIDFINRTIQLDKDKQCFDNSLASQIKGKDVLLKGRGPVELYSFAAYWFVKNGCRTLSVNEYNLDKIIRIYDSTVSYKKELPEWCKLKETDHFSLLEIQKADTPDNKWSDDVILSSESFYFPAKNGILVITGKSLNLFYACAACSAFLSGFENIFISKPTEGQFIRLSGSAFLEKEKNDKKGKMIGILGDPNSGKSVFSRVFGCILDTKSGESKTWVYDCDQAALTSDWYIYGLQKAQSQERIQQLKDSRDSIKQNWNEQLEETVASCMKEVKSNLDYVIADLPGGKHNDEKNIHERIPDKGRASMFENCDNFIIIARKDRAGVAEEWKKELAKYNLEKRVSAVILSDNPDASPSVSNVHFTSEGIYTLTVTGLDRKNSRENLIKALETPLQCFIEKLLNN